MAEPMFLSHKYSPDPAPHNLPDRWPIQPGDFRNSDIKDAMTPGAHSTALGYGKLGPFGTLRNSDLGQLKPNKQPNVGESRSAHFDDSMASSLTPQATQPAWWDKMTIGTGGTVDDTGRYLKDVSRQVQTPDEGLRWGDYPTRSSGMDY